MNVSDSPRFRAFHDGTAKDPTGGIDAATHLTVQCPETGCDALVTSIQRYRVTVEWGLLAEGIASRWDLGTFESGTHFHLFCQNGHEVKRWGNELPKRLQRVVYPNDSSTATGLD